MEEKCSFRGYFFKLKRPLVGLKLLGVLHLFAQIGMVVSVVSFVVTQFYVGIWQGILSIILTVIGIPIASLFIRFGFELLATPFAISRNLAKIKKGLFDFDDFGCDCGGCCGELDLEDFDVEEFLAKSEPMIITPVKKTSVKKSSVKQPETKRPAAKKSVAKKK